MNSFLKIELQIEKKTKTNKIELQIEKKTKTNKCST